MRRILVENARRKRRLRHGGGLARAGVEPDEIAAPEGRPLDELLAVDAALDRLAAADPAAAELVKLRYFAGFSIAESAADPRRLAPHRRPPLDLRPRLAPPGDRARIAPPGIHPEEFLACDSPRTSH